MKEAEMQPIHKNNLIKTKKHTAKVISNETSLNTLHNKNSNKGGLIPLDNPPHSLASKHKNKRIPNNPPKKGATQAREHKKASA